MYGEYDMKMYWMCCECNIMLPSIKNVYKKNDENTKNVNDSAKKEKVCQDRM